MRPCFIPDLETSFKWKDTAHAHGGLCFSTCYYIADFIMLRNGSRASCVVIIVIRKRKDPQKQW